MITIGSKMGNWKKILLIVLLVFAGLLLTLAGANLIELSKDLLLYLGIGLIILAILYYFLLNEPKKGGE